MISDPANPDAWFILAKDRLEKADALYEQFGASWSGVELLQEAAERYLKGFLVARGWNLVKTHDLNCLLASACEFDNSFSCFAPPCQILTEQFWEQHYPGGDLEEVGEGYSELRDAVGRMVQLILVNTNKKLGTSLF
jgi:HEPN domain-containing protein